MGIVAIYARQSIDKVDSVSIESQIDNCKRFFRNDNDEFEVYQDKGFSGKNTNRPRMNQLIEDIKGGKISGVISYRLDRISRNIVDFGNLLTLFEKNNVEFISATENIDTHTPMGKSMVFIIMIFAQMERETISLRVFDNYKFRGNTGNYFMGGNIPFGYTTERKLLGDKKATVIIPNDNSTTLQRIFDMYTSGESLYNITHTLNRENITTISGKLWYPNGIKRILQNITPCIADNKLYEYLSAYGYNITNNIDDFTGENGMCIFMKNKNKHEPTEISKQIAVIGLHKPIISSGQFIKAQIMLNKNSETKNKKSSKQSFLAGLLICDECKNSFGLKSTTQKGNKYSYYYCRSRSSRGGCSNDLYVKANDLEELIIKQCIEYLNNESYSISQSEIINNTTSNSDEILLLEQQISNLIDNVGRGNSSIDTLLTNKIISIQDEISKIKQTVQVDINSSTNSEEFKDLKSKFNSFGDRSMDDKIDSIRKLIDYVSIPKDGNVMIHYKI